MKKLFPFLTVVILILATYLTSNAQCAMCTAVAESSRDSGASVAESINKGVLYIFMMPFLLIATIGYFWWRAGQKARAENSAV